MRWQAALAVPLLAVGCTRNAPRHENQASATSKQAAQEVTATKDVSSSERSNPETSGPASKTNAGVLPPANAAVRYLGTWASSKANCRSRPWRFKRDSLDVAYGPRCSFYNVAKVPGGYDIAAQCPTKQPMHEDLIKLRFAESAQAMLVESNAISPTGLIYCSD